MDLRMREDKDGGRWCTPAWLPACSTPHCRNGMHGCGARVAGAGGAAGWRRWVGGYGRMRSSQAVGSQEGSRRRRLLLPPSSTCRHGRSQNRKTPNRLLLCTKPILCVRCCCYYFFRFCFCF